MIFLKNGTSCLSILEKELVRTLIYTTNPIESVHRQIKKVTKGKSSFPNDQALIKMVYLAVENAAKKWTSQKWNFLVFKLFGKLARRQVSKRAVG